MSNVIPFPQYVKEPRWIGEDASYFLLSFSEYLADLDVCVEFVSKFKRGAVMYYA